MSEENISLPVAQALASALEKIEAYVPTEYVDNSEPDIDAEHLNHAEQGIMRVTNLLNAAVDVIQGQESRLEDTETKIGTAALTGGMTDLSSGVNALYSNLTNVNTDKNKGVIGQDNIGTLSSPSQLTHNGFYAFVNCSADVNSNLDSGAGNFTDYNVGDFYALLIGGQWQSNGCRYGTLIVTSPRFSGKFWIGRIWDYKFANWHKFSGS